MAGSLPVAFCVAVYYRVRQARRGIRRGTAGVGLGGCVMGRGRVTDTRVTGKGIVLWSRDFYGLLVMDFSKEDEELRVCLADDSRVWGGRASVPTIEVIPRSSDQHALSPSASQKSATFPLMSPSPRGAFLRAPKYSGGG